MVQEERREGMTEEEGHTEAKGEDNGKMSPDRSGAVTMTPRPQETAGLLPPLQCSPEPPNLLPGHPGGKFSDKAQVSWMKPSSQSPANCSDGPAGDGTAGDGPLEAAPLEMAPLEAAPLETALLEAALLETAPLETALLETALQETAGLPRSLAPWPQCSLPQVRAAACCPRGQ